MSRSNSDRRQYSGEEGHRPSPGPNVWVWLVGVVAPALVVFVGAFAFSGSEDDPNPADGITVLYEVRGTGAGATVAYLDREHGMVQETGIALPWSKEVPLHHGNSIVSMTAAHGPDGEEITCRILVGGRVMTEQTSSGPRASVGCSGDAAGQ